MSFGIRKYGINLNTPHFTRAIMNRIHRTVWSETRQAYVVAHEKATTRGKPSSTQTAIVQAVAAALLALGAGQAMAVDITVPGTYVSPYTSTINLGTGDNLIISAGAVVSNTSSAAVQVSGSIAGSITNSGTISSPEAGVALYVGGVVANITNIGTISASGTGAGIYLKSASSIFGFITNSGTIDGYYGIQVVGNSVIGNDILNSGHIDAARSAIDISGNSSRVRNIINSGAGVISGNSVAAIGVGGGATIAGITNAGTISSSNGIGIDLASAVITGCITNSGTSSVILGDVASQRVALNINNTDIGGNIINQGTIKGDAGIYLGGSTSIAGDINNQRLIEGVGTGIAFEGSSIVTGVLTNSGTIIATDTGTAGTAGVYFNGGNVGGIVNSGTIQGQAGIHIENGTVSGNITNSNLVRSLGSDSMSAGVILYGSSSVITGSIVNTGTITGAGVGIWVASSAAINGGITNSGTLSRIEGDDYGIQVNDNASVGRILNQGRITSASRGMILNTSSNVAFGITNSGSITGGASDGLAIYSSTVAGGLTNSGLIGGGAGGNGIDIDDGSVFDGDLLNLAGGTISGGGTAAIEIDESTSFTGAIINQGRIQSGLTGIEIHGSAVVQSGITNTGSIIASAAAAGTEIIGVNIDNADVSGGITNSGQIIATNSTVPGLSYGMVIRNTGLVTGGIHNLTGGTISGGGGGIFLQNNGEVKNGITNSGLIQGTDGIGIMLSNGSISGGIVNLSGGRIVGGNGIAISIDSPSPIAISNASGGTITGHIYANTTFGSNNAVAVDITNSGLWDLPEDPVTPNTYMTSYLSGSFNQGSTGTLRIGVYGAGAGEYSQLALGGSATLGGTLDVNVKGTNVLANGNILDNVITATGGITGTFASITDNSAMFDFTGIYNANDFDLNVVASGGGGGGGGGSTAMIDAVRGTGNTPGIGDAIVLDGLTDRWLADGTTGNAGMDRVITALGGLSTQQQLSDAVSQTLPLLTGSSTFATSEALASVFRIVHSRMEANRGLSSGDEFYGDKKFWMKPFGSWADQNDRGAVSGFSAKTAGLIFGADATLSSTDRLGLAFAYAHSNIDSNSNVAPNSANVNIYHLLGYGSHLLDENTELNFQVGLGQNDTNGSRQVLFMNQVAKSDYASQVASAGIGVGRTYQISELTRFSPSIRADYLYIKDNGYTEKGSDADLKVKSHSTDELILSIDGKLSHEIAKGATLNANLGVGYDVLNKQSSIVSAYAGAPSEAFTTYGLDPSPWLVRGGVGIVSTTASGMEITARYDADYRQDFLNQTVAVKVMWAF